MGGEFSLDSSGLMPLSDIHTQVADGLSQLTGAGAPQAADAARSFGNIAFAVNTALDGVTQSRISTIATTKSSSDTIADLLGTADKMYAQGDQEGAEKLKAAAKALENAEGGNAAGGPGATSGGAAGAGGGGDQAGQMASQVGQQVGQIASTMAQSVQGLAQGLTQLPQQIMQGVQGIVQSATQAGAGAKEDDPTAENRDDERKAEERGEKAHAAREAVPAQRDEAQPGKSAEQGRAPAPTPPVERAQPAQTRPQQSPI